VAGNDEIDCKARGFAAMAVDRMDQIEMRSGNIDPGCVNSLMDNCGVSSKHTFWSCFAFPTCVRSFVDKALFPLPVVPE